MAGKELKNTQAQFRNPKAFTYKLSAAVGPGPKWLKENKFPLDIMDQHGDPRWDVANDAFEAWLDKQVGEFGLNSEKLEKSLKVPSATASKLLAFTVRTNSAGYTKSLTPELEEVYVGAKQEPPEWTFFSPAFDDYPSFERSVPPAQHFAVKLHCSVFVSDRVRQVVLETGLKGLDLTAARPQHGGMWWRAIPQKFMGRGISHPFLDPTKSTPESASFVPSAEGERDWHFTGSQLHVSTNFDIPENAALLELASTTRFTLMVCPTFLRANLPTNVDFAYGVKNDGNGIYLSRRALEIFQKHNLIHNRDRKAGVWVLDSMLPHMVDHDKILPPYTDYTDLVPLYKSDVGITADAPLEQSDILLPKLPQKKRPTFDDVLKRLEKFLIKDDQELEPLSEKEIQKLRDKLKIPLPKRFVDLVKLSADFVLIDTADFEITADFVSRHKDDSKYFRECVEGPFPKGRFFFASSGGGDSYTLDTTRIDKDGDCPVEYYSLSEMRLSHEWPSMADMLSEQLDLTEKPVEPKTSAGTRAKQSRPLAPQNKKIPTFESLVSEILATTKSSRGSLDDNKEKADDLQKEFQGKLPERLLQLHRAAYTLEIYDKKADFDLCNHSNYTQKALKKEYAAIHGKPMPADYIFFAYKKQAPEGFYLLDLSRPVEGGDCAVILLDYITLREVRSWDSLAELLHEQLEASKQ